MKTIKHPNIIKYHEFYEDEPNGCFVIVTEFFEPFDLESFLPLKDKECNVKTIISQICETIENLHLQKISHGDLNLSNILIDGKTLQIKIIDFGLAKIIENSDECSPCQGNYNFRPPKHIKVLSSFNNDVWSVALIAMSLIKGKVVNTNKALKIMKKEEKNPELDKISMFLNELLKNNDKKCDICDLKKIL